MFLDQRKSGIRGFVYGVLAVFVALFPFLLFRGYLYAGTATRAVLLMLVVEVLALVFAFSLFSKKTTLKVMKSPITIALGTYILILVISMVAGADSGISFWSKATRMTGVFYLSHLALFYLFLTMIFQEGGKLRRFLKTFLIASGLFSLAYLFGPEGFKVIFPDRTVWDGFTFMNSTFAAMYLYASFMLAIYYTLTIPQEKRRWWKYLFPLVFVINPSFVNASVWRGDFSGGVLGESFASTYAALLSVGLLGLIYGISRIRSAALRKKTAIALVAIGVIVAGIAIGSLLTRGGALQKLYLSQSSAGRPIVWALSDRAISERPLLGWGPENFEIAYERHYDNTVLENRNGGEAWFDRAHNVFIDQAVDTGYVGVVAYTLVYLVIIGCLLYALLRAKERNDQVLASILLVYFAAHVAELQTAFDTSISYVPLTIMAALSTVLFAKVKASAGKENAWSISNVGKHTLGVVLLGYFGWATIGGTIPIMSAETANGAVRTVGSGEKRLPLYPALFGSPMDKPSFLWRTSTDFQRGIGQDPSVLADPAKVQFLVKELDVFAQEYRDHLMAHPNDFRAHLTLADILIYYKLFDIDKLGEAQQVLDKALLLNNTLPQPYWMKAVAYLYQAKFKEAREWAAKGLAVNPGIEESKRVSEYIEQSIKDFPEIDLFFFQKI